MSAMCETLHTVCSYCDSAAWKALELLEDPTVQRADVELTDGRGRLHLGRARRD